MTKLCPRGKAAAKRKFKVYPSAYANAYASKICAGKIKDPSGTKRKDWGPKKAKVGMAVNAGSQSGMGRLQKSGLKLSKGGGSDFETSATRIKPYGKTHKVKIERLKSRKKVKNLPIGPPLSGDKGMQQPFSKYDEKMYTKPKKKMMSGGFGIFGKKKKEEEKKSVQEENANKKKKRLEELRKEIGAKKGKMMIMIAIGKPKKAKEGMMATPKPDKDIDTQKKPIFPKNKKKAPPGDPKERHEYLRNLQNPKSEYDKKGKLKYTFANKGKIMQVANKLEKASKAHAGQAKTLKSLKLSRGGGAAIRGTNFKGVF